MPLVDKVIWQIETHLDEPLTLELLADRVCVNVHHMCRAFQLRTGHSVMGYTRARRLAKAAQAIADGERDLIQVALTAGYGSHAAFTRAFSAAFGVAPSAVREAEDLTFDMMEPIAMDQTKPIPIAAPEIRTHDAFRVTGFATDVKNRDIAAVPGLWQQFAARLDEFGPYPSETFGVSFAMTEDGDFSYLAGMQSAAQPKGAAQVEVPAGRYAVFTHKGHIADLPPFYAAIWDHGVSDHGLTPAYTPEFERYGDDFDAIKGYGRVEIWIPLADAT